MRVLSAMWPESPESLRWRGRLVVNALWIGALLLLSMVPGKG